MAIRVCTLKNQHEFQIPKLALTESLACTEDLEAAATFSMLKFTCSAAQECVFK